MDFYDVERLEVLRGPQGTLWGKNTTAGAISIHTRDPSDEYEAQLESERRLRAEEMVRSEQEECERSQGE